MTQPPLDERYEEKIVPPRLEPVDPKVLYMGLQRMKNAARGNGVDPDTITLHTFLGYTVDYDAQSLFVIQPTVAHKSLPGKEKGEVCGSHSDLHNRIREATEKTLINTDIINFAVTALDRRKDKGFMVDGFGLKFDRLARTFLYYNSCTNCTAGHINCMACQGAGLINCPRCKGARKLKCPACRGTRHTRDSKGRETDCRTCHARGEIPCQFCKSAGRIRCKACNGTGETKCPKCAATGIISEMAYVSFEGKTKFSYDAAILPEPMVPLLDQIGPELVLRDYADVKILKEKKQAAAQKDYNTAEKPKLKDELVVPFNVRLPWGSIQFRVGPDILNGRVFGKHPRLLGITPFIEGPIAPGIAELEQAVSKGGNMQAHIEEATKFRIIADAMVAASAMTKKKALLHMRKRWSVGINGKTTDHITALAADAYANISKTPRLIGLGLGLGIAAMIDAAYILGPLRPLLLSYGLPSIGVGAIDALVAAGTGLIAQSASRLTAKKALWHLFKKLVPADQLHKIKPQAGTVGLYAYLAAGVIFCLVIIAAAYGSHAIPDWAQYLMVKARML
ncbi:MAG: hypothetical protein JWO78_2476 [Micavibrio sp.]|nr:hypothetical protein [Micavibrio sp.]